MFRQLDKSETKERLERRAHFGDEHETRVEAQQSAAAEAFAVREEQRALGGVQEAHAAGQRELAPPVRAARLRAQRAHATARTRRGQQGGQTRRVRHAARNPTARENETLDVSTVDAPSNTIQVLSIKYDIHNKDSIEDRHVKQN